MSWLRNDPGIVARKPHRCDLCGETITKGSPHRIYVGKDGGDIYTCRFHPECDMVTEIDKWDQIDWEGNNDEIEFRKRRDELRADGRLS